MFKTTKTAKPTIAIIGAGAAGIGSALLLAEKGYHIHLFEKDRIGCGASGRNPGRMGLGFHYTDQETAKAYLHASILVQRTYPGYLIAQDKPRYFPLRRGRYFILKNSDESREKILACYHAIQEEYQRLIDADPANEVFGPAKELYRILDPKEYQNTVNMELVDIGVETAEHLFNWDAFMCDIRARITERSEHIQLHEHTEVLQIIRNAPDKPRFSIETKAHEQTHPLWFDTDYIINSTWQNIEKFNDQLGLTMIPRSRTNRLKTLLTIKLPAALETAHSMFFCMGQHCMFSNLGNGNGMITFAKVTNLEVSTAISISQNAERLIQGGVTEAEKRTIAQQMLTGVSQYIPAIIDAIPIELKFGIVQTKGSLQLEDLHNPQHPFHQREDHCVETKQIGMISNPCMKLFYFLDNAHAVLELIESHQTASNVIHRCAELLQQACKTQNIQLTPVIHRTILENLARYETANLEEGDISPMVTTLLSTIQRKQSLGFFFNRSKSKASHAEPGAWQSLPYY